MRPLVMIQGELFDLPLGGPQGPSTTSKDPMPRGPYALSMLFDMEMKQYVVPFSVVGVDGKTVAGHIPSLEIAKAVRDALNAVFVAQVPVGSEWVPVAAAEGAGE